MHISTTKYLVICKKCKLLLLLKRETRLSGRSNKQGHSTRGLLSDLQGQRMQFEDLG